MGRVGGVRLLPVSMSDKLPAETEPGEAKEPAPGVTIRSPRHNHAGNGRDLFMTIDN